MNPQPSALTRQRSRDKDFYRHYKLRWPGRVLLTGLHFGMWLWLDVEKLGWENIPRTGPVIMMINHIAFLDPVILTGMMPRPMVSMAKIEAYEDKIIGPLLRSFDSIPVNRGAADLSALRRVLDALEAGLAVLIAPEGHRSETGGLGEAHEGIAFVAYRAKVPIVPVGISGTPAFKYNYWKMHKTHVTYRFGQPFTLDPGGERVTTEMLKQMTDEAMYQLAALLPPEQRGLYADLDQATAKYVKFAPQGK
jgi:1-acyl-sn-glycerol-3-phosphate acyltransferase